MKSLQNVLSEIEVEEQEVQSQPFEVTNQESAAEALRRITYFMEQIQSVENIVQTQIQPFESKIEKIKAWGEDAKQEHYDRIKHYESLLEAYMRLQVTEQESKGKKPKKTLKLPYGAIKLKKQQPEFVRDEEKLLEYAKSIGMVKVKESADWSEIKKQCTVVGEKLVNEDGEVVPGISINERPEKFEFNIEG
jgi:Bacteriophage Mu Gam like protein